MSGQSINLDNIALGDIMTRDVITISSDSSAGEAAKLMLKNKIHGLCITDKDDNSKIKYIVTTYDILGMIYFGRFTEDTDFIKNTRIENLVRDQQMISFAPGHTVKDALEVIADRNIRTLPIVEDGKLVGVVSIIDIIKAMMRG